MRTEVFGVPKRKGGHITEPCPKCGSATRPCTPSELKSLENGDVNGDVDRMQKELACHGAALVRSRSTKKLRKSHLRVKAFGGASSVEYMILPLEDGSGDWVGKRFAGQRLWKLFSDDNMQRALSDGGAVAIWLRHNGFRLELKQ